LKSRNVLYDFMHRHLITQLGEHYNDFIVLNITQDISTPPTAETHASGVSWHEVR
jgi:hypothetical protein